MKKYEVSFSNTHHYVKPTGSEVGRINNELHTKSIDYKELAYMVGEHGCTFSPAVYNGKRRKEGYIGQQLIALDFDNGIAFSEIKRRAEQYRLSILFAYKTFSYTSEHEKFRVVFALKTMISDSFTAEVLIAMFMKIFSECDSACKDCSRMFFGGKGLLLLAEESVEISESEVVISFIEYMNDRYGETHYTRELKKFYQRLGVKYEKAVPKIMNGKFIYDGDSSSVKERR
jgi:hypothetical protein